MKHTIDKFAPICLFVYNRLWHTQQTLTALSKNTLAKNSDLIIFSDGPKNEADNEKVVELRQYLKTVQGFKSVVIVEQPKNLGLANSIINGVTDVLNRYPTVIVLEDDLVTSSKFLAYMNDALQYYGSCSNVASVHGYVYPFKKPMENDFFIYGADCWGWATWKEQWSVFESDGSKLLEQLEKSGRVAEFDFNVSVGYSAMLKAQIAGHNNSWAIRWKASCFLLNKLTLYPCQSFVQNIGLDSSGTHCSATDIYRHAFLCEDYSLLEPVLVEHSNTCFKKMGNFYRANHPSFISKINKKLSSIIHYLMNLKQAFFR